MLKLFRVYTILLCALVAIGCSDNAINNAVAPATEKEKIVREVDNTLRVIGYEKGDFIWKKLRNYEITKGIYVGMYQNKEVWLYGFFKKGDLIIGTEIENPVIVDTWIRKVTDLKTGTEQNIRFIEIKLPD